MSKNNNDSWRDYGEKETRVSLRRRALVKVWCNRGGVERGGGKRAYRQGEKKGKDDFQQSSGGKVG